MSKGSVCTLATSVKCSQIKPSDELPPRPIVHGPIRASEENDLAESLPRCVVCVLAVFPVSKSVLGQRVPLKIIQPGQEDRQVFLPGLRTELEVRFQARKDGTVDQIQVTGQSSKEIKDTVLKQVATWVVEPAGRSALSAQDTYNFKLRVSCDGFGSEDHASCFGFIPHSTTNRHMARLRSSDNAVAPTNPPRSCDTAGLAAPRRFPQGTLRLSDES